MRIVEPKVYLIAGTAIRMGQTTEWLADLGGLACTDNITGSAPETLIELCGRRCYKSFAPGLNPNISKVRTDSHDYHANILSSRHGSVLEHASATFAIECVSRVFTHELVRHRVGTAFSQESLRYVRLTDLGFIMPPEIVENDNGRALFIQTVKDLERAQEQLAALFDIDNIKEFSKKKTLTSAFRRIAPDGLATGIVVTMNFRAMRHLIELRTHQSAEYEIRRVFNDIAQIAVREWPMVMQDFEQVGAIADPYGLPMWVPKYSKV